MTDPLALAARRRFLKLAGAGVAAAPFGGMLMRPARAQEKLSPEDELAQQLGYHEDAAQVDADEWPDYAEGHICANCQLFTGAEGDEWGPCEIFGGQLVSAKGWCQAWIER